MNETLKKLILDAVEFNITIDGLVGSSYTVQDLLHNANLNTIDSLYQGLYKKINKLENGSLENNNNSKELNKLQNSASLLKEIFHFRKALLAEKTQREANRKKALEEAAIIKKVLAEKKIDTFKNKTEEFLEKHLENLENLTD